MAFLLKTIQGGGALEYILRGAGYNELRPTLELYSYYSIVECLIVYLFASFAHVSPITDIVQPQSMT